MLNLTWCCKNTYIIWVPKTLSVYNWSLLSVFCSVWLLHQPQEAPDGHRAPLPLCQRSASSRSIDTQTPLGTAQDHSNSSSRSQSISPAFLNVPSEPCSDSPSPHEDETLADGCEKGTALIFSHPHTHSGLVTCPRPTQKLHTHFLHWLCVNMCGMIIRKSSSFFFRFTF